MLEKIIIKHRMAYPNRSNWSYALGNLCEAGAYQWIDVQNACVVFFRFYFVTYGICYITTFGIWIYLLALPRSKNSHRIRGAKSGDDFQERLGSLCKTLPCFDDAHWKSQGWLVPHALQNFARIAEDLEGLLIQLPKCAEAGAG